jgi:hypothetical protein
MGGAMDGGIKMWQGVPPPEDPSAFALPAPEREPFSLPDPDGRGPLPLWGGAVPELDGAAPPREDRGSLTLRHDAMGPVIAPRPPDDGGAASDGR